MFPPMSSDRARWLLLAVAAAVLVVHAFTYNFITDDAYISFVFSRNLAEHGELTFNLGTAVEGYTNFSWTVLLAGALKLGVPIELAAKLLALVCSLGTLALTVRLMDRALERKSAWAAVPALLLASSSGFACWTSGGLETQLFVVLVTVALDAVSEAALRPRAIVRAAIALGFSAMTRPEGLLVAALLGVTHLVTLVPRARRGGLRALGPDVVAIVSFLVVWAPWFLWRYRYYGYPFPNTYYVKAAGPWRDPALAHDMLNNGAYYVLVWLRQTKLVFALPLVAVGLVVGRPRSPRFVLAIAMTLIVAAYVPYTITVGGDFMGLHRFIMPLFVVAALATALGAEYVLRRIGRPAITAIAGVALVGAFAFSQYHLTRTSLRWGNWANDRGIDTPAYLIVYTEDRAAIGRAMAPCFRPDDFSIVGGAGAQPYFGRMRGIDVFGLVSTRIAHEEPRVRARAGHTKFATDALLAQYDPTFIFSCYAITRSTAPPPRLPCAASWEARGYTQVSMKIPGLRQQGDLYTFLAKRARDFQCPGLVAR